MIQDISPKIFLNSYRPDAKVDANSIILLHSGGCFLMKIDEDKKEIEYPRFRDFSIPLSTVYLFSVDEEDFFLVENSSDITETDYPSGYEFCNMKQLRNDYLSPKHYVFVAFTALQLAEWYEGTVFCGKCGNKTEHSKTERAKVCPVCGKTVYPRINPAVIVGVTNGDKLLLTKYKTGFAHNALVAGFTEIGETVEETVRREVMEEAGLKVKNIRYYKSQPWGIASDILMGFYCDVDGDDTITMDESELKYAEWVNREDIILQPLEYSLTNEMMKRFKEDMAKRIIQLAQEKDKQEILQLYKSQLGREYCPWNEYYPGSEEIDFDLSRDSLFVMKEDEKIIAAITIDDDDNVTSLPYWTAELLPGAELSRLAVSIEHQNNGLAKDMMSYGMTEIKRRGFKSVHFLVNRKNLKALKCYEAFGFNKVGECELYDQPMLCYEKAL